ncbi:HEAT repeat domain containing protein [Entamoeba marina]
MYRIQLSNTLLILSHFSVDLVKKHFEQIIGTTLVLIQDERELVFNETLEIIISLLCDFAEIMIPLTLKLIPLFFDRCLLTNEWISQLQEEESVRSKEQSNIQDEDTINYNQRIAVFSVIDAISSSFGDEPLALIITTIYHTYEMKQNASQDWRNLEVFISLMNCSLIYWKGDDLLARFGEIVKFVIRSLNDQNVFVRKQCIDFIGHISSVVQCFDKELQNQIYLYLIQSIKGASYNISCSSLSTLTRIVHEGIFKEYAKDIMQIFIPFIQTTKGKPFIDIADLLTTVIDNNYNETTEFHIQVVDAFIYCIQKNINDENAVDISLFTICSLLDFITLNTIDIVTVFYNLIFQCIARYPESNDVVSSSFRLMASVYKSNKSIGSQFILSNQDAFMKLFVFALPNDHKMVIDECYGFIGDIIENCQPLFKSNIQIFIQQIINKINTFKDTSLCHVIWCMYNFISFMPNEISIYLETFIQKTLPLLTDERVDTNVKKNLLSFIGKTINFDIRYYSPYVQIITGSSFKYVLEFKNPQIILSTVLSFAHLITTYPELCKMNKKIIETVFIFAADLFPDITEISKQVLTALVS